MTATAVNYRGTKAKLHPSQQLLYLQEHNQYCQTCGRVITPRRSHKKGADSGTPVKYCSDRCRNNKPNAQDREIEATFVTFLSGGHAAGSEAAENGAAGERSRRPRKKGDPRVLVPWREVFERIFGPDPEDTATALFPGRPKQDWSQWRSVDMEDKPVKGSGGYGMEGEGEEDGEGRSSGEDSGVQVELTEEQRKEMLVKRREGQKRADARERVKQAARRGCVLGFTLADGSVQKCEAISNGKLVEPSFAKGYWAIRWRED